MLYLRDRLRGLCGRGISPDLIGANGCLPLRFKQLFLMIDQILWIVGGQLVVLLQRDCAGGAGSLAVATEDATQHIYIEDFRVPFAGGDAILFCVLFGLNVDGVRRARARAEVAANAPPLDKRWLSASYLYFSGSWPSP